MGDDESRQRTPRDESRERTIRQQSSMTYWWPKLRDSDVPTPQTIRLKAHEKEIEDSSEAEGGFTVHRPDNDEIVDAISEVGGPPAFFRSDQLSAKHRMAKGSKLSSDDPEEFGPNVWNVVEANAMAMGVPRPEAYYVREWLDLWHQYTAFTGTPIAAELRYFIHDGDVHGFGFYWPEDAISRPDADDWVELHEMTRETALSNPLQRRSEHFAKDVAAIFDEGYWSVDFALTEDQQWVCIDMARGEASWHPEGVEKPEGVAERVA